MADSEVHLLCSLVKKNVIVLAKEPIANHFGVSLNKISRMKSILAYQVRHFSSKNPRYRGKTAASVRWLQRQENDPYVKQAKREGFRSRAAIKLTEINSKHQVIHPGDIVVDLGAAPGGWTQVAVKLVQSKGDKKNIASKSSNVIAVDILKFDEVEGAHNVVGDFRKSSIRKLIDGYLGGREVDVVISDMAPSFSGHFHSDSEAQMRLCENALTFSTLYLKSGGRFVTKILNCDGKGEYRDKLKELFGIVREMKPESSRQESTETYFIAKKFKQIKK